MCGILGILTNDTYVLKADNFLKDGLLVSQVRGMHSTGLYQVGTNGEISMYKKAVNASAFLDENDAKAILAKSGRSRVTVGHVRHATVGAKDKDENAHPFRITRADGSELVGVHNGSFRNWKNKKNSKDVDVDSAWAIQMLADENFDAFEYFDGAFALVWYDTRTPDIVYMARNKERPLHYFVTEDGKSMYFMSELGSLGWIAGRNEIKKNTSGFRYIEPGHIYKFSLKKIGDYTSVEYPAYDPKTTVYTPASNVMNHYRGNYNPLTDMYGDDSDWGDRDPWDERFQGRRYPSQWRAHTPGYVAPDYNLERTERVLGGVKEALKQARNKADQASNEASQETVVDMEQLERAIEEAIDEHNKSKEKKPLLLIPLSNLSRPMFIAAPIDSSVSQDEKRLVQDMALYGQVVDFDGIVYDEDEKVVEGEITIFQGGKWITAEAHLRNVPPAKAKFLYTKGRYPQRVAVVGYNNDPGRGLPPVFVLSELNTQQRSLILVEAGKLSAAH